MMKKHLLLFFVCSVASLSFAEKEEGYYPPSDPTKSEDQYKWQKWRERAAYRTGKYGGALGGALGGSLSSVPVTVGGLEKIFSGVTQTKRDPVVIFSPVAQTGINVGVLGGGAAGYFAGRDAIARWYAKEYRVSERVALAAYMAGETAANPEMWLLFVRAEEKDKNYLRRYLSELYAQRLGPDWQRKVPQLLDDITWQDRGQKLYKKIRFGEKGIEVDRSDVKKLEATLPLTYALSILYFNESFYGLHRRWLYRTPYVREAQKLFDALFR